MSEIALGVDLGTTTITALALEPGSHEILAQQTVVNDAEITPGADKARGRSEWDSRRMVDLARQCLRSVSEKLGNRGKDVAGLGITGQQHGVVLVDRDRQPLTPLVNWQDRRGDERLPGDCRTFAEQAAFLSGDDARQRTGCGLATGFMGVTLFWWKVHGLLPAGGVACFIGDCLAGALTGRPPVSDPTNAASSGLFDVRQRCWDAPMRESLGLPAWLFPEIREADQPLGPLTLAAAAATGLPAGIPVFVAFGDSQAAFLGSVEDRRQDILINVGTGAQVIAAIDKFSFVPPLETRPLPRCGNLLVSAQLCGGRSYAALEEFFRGALRNSADWTFRKNSTTR